MGVLIQTPQLTMEIKIVSLSKLHSHEMTIPKALARLKHEIQSCTILKHPIIVDSQTFVILDGMHRFAALQSLGCKLVPVCLIDYRNPSIELYSWYRVISGSQSFLEITQSLRHLSVYNSFSSNISESINMVNNRNAFTAIITEKESRILRSPAITTIKQIYDEIAQVENLIRQLGYRISYFTETDALESLKTSNNTILVVPSATKQEVVNTALQGELFSQKTTRHIVPARPLFVNIPLKWLYETTPHIIDEKMKQFLDNKQIVRLERGAVIEGRRYEECAYVFRD